MTTLVAPDAILAEITPFAAPLESGLDTASWFDAAHMPQAQSPIDEFRANLAEINTLYLQAHQRGDYNSTLGGLVYLGMVSAVEGYFRSLLRHLILTDEMCAENAASKTVSYAAAVHHRPELLPEALLEGVSLASTKNIKSELNSLCNVAQISASLDPLFQTFEDICQIRHCGIHRFGKLGSQQAVKLGLEKHKPLLEKPLRLTIAHLQDVAEALEALVRGVNSHCFFDMLKRSHDNSPAGKNKTKYYSASWNRDWVADQSRFEKFHWIFASTHTSNPSKPAKEMYDAFMAFIAAKEAGQ